ncbi:hypothetical protein GUITHDRAFT_135494 [Guillardia theta CCMP2712]|uniref:Uncharacterized protein n=1 Tax=Guillardia theta (strain CCMP2712) TaxID=905079 RepID=L1JQ15_GUITC|nr:hypothetical protein GUITHDRAFT_135494 [Guillardia theta CCMP2712]EKX50354.1 hypothetical protein GUITHDRAFT_135494 [Guillardia theta CCMP2712]|eukprot:XP_005837334.1 hypothetical protein GUITHDRAFT_135494 [Guillardia theta CCMP2712]
MGRKDFCAMTMVAMASLLVASCDMEVNLASVKTANNLHVMVDCLNRIRSYRTPTQRTGGAEGCSCDGSRGVQCERVKLQGGRKVDQAKEISIIGCCKDCQRGEAAEGHPERGARLLTLRGGEQERGKKSSAAIASARSIRNVLSMQINADEGTWGKRFGEAAFSSLATDKQSARRQRALSPPSLEGSFPVEGLQGNRALASRAAKGSTRLYSLRGVKNDPGKPEEDGATMRAMPTSSFKRAVECDGRGMNDLLDEVDIILMELRGCRDAFKKRQLLATLFVKAPVGHRKAIEAACGALLDKRESISVRNAACLVISKLGLVGDPKVVTVLARSAKMDECFDIRKQSLRCLATKAIKSDQTAIEIAFDILRKKVSSPSMVIASYRPGSQTAWKLLLCRVLDDAVLDVRLEAVRALTKIADGDMLADGGARETVVLAVTQKSKRAIEHVRRRY